MARPAKAIKTASGKRSALETKIRADTEEKLKGDFDRLQPPEHLTRDQKKIFRFIVKEMKASEILSNLDVFVLTSCAIAVDRLNAIEAMINENIDLIMSTSLMATKDKYTKDLYRCCNELCLSPQARAKIGSISAALVKEESNPLMDVLKDDDD